jgi:hypothetical protein
MPAFTTAFEGNDQTKLAALSGWMIGFFSGVAQGTGIDFLRNADVQTVTLRVLEYCNAEPNKLLSLATEEIAKSMATGQPLH